VPHRYKEDPRLGNWVRNQLLLIKKGRISVERKEKLDDIGLEVSVKERANEEYWNLQFQKLRCFFAKHGHCELFWGVDPFAEIVNTHTNTPPVFLPAFQVKYHKVTFLTRN
jgi:hypothetical protein